VVVVPVYPWRESVGWICAVARVNCRDLPPGNRQAPLLRGVEPRRQRRGSYALMRSKMAACPSSGAGPALVRSSSVRSRGGTECAMRWRTTRGAGDTKSWDADAVAGSVPGTLLMESAGCGKRRSRDAGHFAVRPYVAHLREGRLEVLVSTSPANQIWRASTSAGSNKRTAAK
jgi:hypothetical protein